MWDIVTPALAAGLVVGAGLVLEVVGDDFGRGGGDLVGTVEVELEGGDGEVVGVGGVEDELVVRVGVAGAEFALDGAVAGADVGVQYVANDFPHVFELGEFGSGPVVQKLGALEDVVPV